MGNTEKAEKLGMPFGTATGRLRKILLFDLVQKLDLDTCYRCGLKIESIDEFSIEHKKSWYGDKDPVKAFFDLGNIAYSHASCNSRHGLEERQNPVLAVKGQSYDKPRVNIATEGQAWCTNCGPRPVEEFTKNSAKWNGVQDLCRTCRSEYRSSK